MPTNQTDILTERIPPQAVEVEQSVLGAMLIEQEAVTVAAQMLKPTDFYSTKNRYVFQAIYKLYDANKPLDMISVENELRDMKLLEEVGGLGYLADLTRSVSSAASTDYHCQIIIEKAKARDFIQSTSKLIDRAFDTGEDVYEILESAEKFIYESLTGENSNQMQTLDKVMEDSLEYILSIQGNEGGIIGIPSGLDYDQITSGWQPGKLYTIAGRPGMGKTAFMLHILKSACTNNYKAGVISLEMGKRSLGTRLIMAEAGVDNQRAMQGMLSEDEMKRVNEAAIRLMDLGMVIDDTAMLTPPLLRIKARMMKQLYDIDLLAVDYLQLMQSEGKQSREQEVADISRTLKLLSKELDIPIIDLAQLSRKPDERHGWKTRPQLADLRESGAIEQDSDVVIFLWRPEYYKLDTYPDGPRAGQSTEGITEVDIAKHREGPTGIKLVYFNKKSMNFENLTNPTHSSMEPTGASYLDDERHGWLDG